MAKEPKFFWRGVMIVAPVLVLTGIGLYSLKQDRLLAQAQARERAQELADDFAEEVMAALQKDGPDGLRLELDADGELIFPPPLMALVPGATNEALARYTS